MGSRACLVVQYLERCLPKGWSELCLLEDTTNQSADVSNIVSTDALKAFWMEVKTVDIVHPSRTVLVVSPSDIFPGDFSNR